MSEHLLRLLSSELTTLRVHCLNPKCGAVVESSLAFESLTRIFRGVFCCPVCRERFAADPMAPDYLSQLATALAGLQQARDAGKASVEFVLPEPK